MMPATEEALWRNARRWLVLGSSGSGKTTLAKRLAATCDLPVIHMDSEFWHPGWVQPEKAAWASRVRGLVEADEWVMDGNYSSTLPVRLERADVAILLDIPVSLCLWSVYRRSLSGLGQVRPDLPEGCPEQLPDREFLHYILSYKRRSRPKVLRLVGESDVPLIRLRSRREADAFLSRVESTVARG